MRVDGRQISKFIAITVVLGAILVTALPAHNIYAAQITSRSLTLEAGSTDGGSMPGGVVNHLFSFTLPTSGAISSIQFTYCTTAAGTCVTPSGLTTTAATLGTQTGITFTSLVNTTNGAPYLTTTTPITISPGTNNIDTFQLRSITNPNGTDCSNTQNNCTFYVRIASYASTNATGSPVDTGVVAAAVVQQILLTGIMPESLIFCAGGTIMTTNSVPDCTTTTSGSVNFNQLFSPTATATATSQMAASTNASSGYVITVNGPTLTSGTNSIPAMTTANTSIIGSGQFGMNLVANTTPTIGTAVTPSSNGTNFRGQPVPSSGYDVANTFKFNSTDAVANSAEGGAGGTDAQIFTASYIVNVAGHQTAGTYTTTLTYICTPTF